MVFLWKDIVLNDYVHGISQVGRTIRNLFRFGWSDKNLPDQSNTTIWTLVISAFGAVAITVFQNILGIFLFQYSFPEFAIETNSHE